MAQPVNIRPATPDDAAALAAIYNRYVATSTATFDTESKSAAERAAWVAHREPCHPVLVAEREGAVVGFGALSPFRERLAYRFTAEAGVYLEPEECGAGTGALLLRHLIERGRDAGLHVVVAQIVADNAASLRLTEKFGFERVGVLREVGRKFDTWLDVVILQLVLGESAGFPQG